MQFDTFGLILYSIIQILFFTQCAEYQNRVSTLNLIQPHSTA